MKYLNRCLTTESLVRCKISTWPSSIQQEEGTIRNICTTIATFFVLSTQIRQRLREGTHRLVICSRIWNREQTQRKKMKAHPSRSQGTTTEDHAEPPPQGLPHHHGFSLDLSISLHHELHCTRSGLIGKADLRAYLSWGQEGWGRRPDLRCRANLIQHRSWHAYLCAFIYTFKEPSSVGWCHTTQACWRTLETERTKERRRTVVGRGKNIFCKIKNLKKLNKKLVNLLT